MKVIFKIKENGDLKIEKSGRLTKIEKVLLIDIVEKMNMNIENELLTINNYKKVSFNMFSFDLQVQKVSKIECILKYTLLDLEYENLAELTINYMNAIENGLSDSAISSLNEFTIDNDMLEAGISEKDQRELYDCLHTTTTKDDLKYFITKEFSKNNNIYFEDLELLSAIIAA